MQKKYSLQSMIVGFSSLLVGLTIFVVNYFSYQQSAHVGFKELDLRAETLIKTFSYRAIEGILVQDDEKLDNLCTDMLKETSVKYALIFDNRGQLLHQVHKDENNDFSAKEKLSEIDFSVDKIKKKYLENILGIIKEVPDRSNIERTIGYVELGISLSNILQYKRQLIGRLLLVSSLVLFSGIVISYFFSKWLSDQLCKVIHGFTTIVSEMDLVKPLQLEVNIKEVQEIQVLFNLMIAKIVKSQEVLNSTSLEFAQNRERLELAFDASQIGLWDWDIPSGNVTFNHCWAEMLGYELNEIRGHVSSWETLIHPDDRGDTMASLGRYLNGETSVYRTEHRMRCKNGKWLWVLDTGKVVSFNSRREPIRAIGTHVDIQARKDIEKKLDKHRENLEVRIAKRTQELKKIQSELLNNAVDAGRAQVSAMVLHNIGNAVTPVSVNLEKLRAPSLKNARRYLMECYNDLALNKTDLTNYVTRDERGKKVSSYMKNLIQGLETVQDEQKVIIDKIEVGVQYIGEILSLQRAYAPGNKVMKEKTILNQIVKDALKIQDSAINRRKIHILVHYHKDPLYILIEKNRLMQVLINLIKNSCDAIDENQERQDHEISIDIFEKGDTIGITMADTGSGIEAEDIDKIFKFGVSSKGSSGFGLYYCKTFVEANNGRLTIDSDGKNFGALAVLEFNNYNR